MSWATVLTIAAGAYFFKAAGTFGLGRYLQRPTMLALGMLLPPALLAALVAVQTFSTGTSLVIDARAAGVIAGGMAVWRKAPFWLVVVIAAAVTATARAVS
jgi:hypothetical protein